ncbi:hypothetical protein AVEN_12762-1 [Araneus ventricosus]|uniref:Uncharacterized protein n=1 Tax=Araneus ventricosus TaxID=182803 RepID=A0A4Y2AD10_ARAVE|nr:hypothetical protein AVEN_12762-1 [Araneus ventricosus]
MASFNIGNDGGLLRYTFDSKNPLNQKLQGVKSEDLGVHASEKDRLITRSSTNAERSRRCTGAAIAVGLHLEKM